MDNPNTIFPGSSSLGEDEFQPRQLDRHLRSAKGGGKSRVSEPSAVRAAPQLVPLLSPGGSGWGGKDLDWDCRMGGRKTSRIR